jgi:hypothetical protein
MGTPAPADSAIVIARRAPTELVTTPTATGLIPFRDAASRRAAWMIRAMAWGVDDSGWTKLERLTFETARWRMELEIRLVGAMLNLPRVGLAQAEAAGVTADLIERPDAWLMYLAMLCCARDGSIDDRTAVLAMARHVLRASGYWDVQAKAHERGLRWSGASLVNLVCRGDGDGVEDVACYAAQLVDLDRRAAEARRCWAQMIGALEGVGSG